MNARFLIFAPLGADARNPMILGAIAVPECFEPSDEMIDTAERAGCDLFIMTGPPDAVPSYLMAQGARFMDRLAKLRSAALN